MDFLSGGFVVIVLVGVLGRKSFLEGGDMVRQFQTDNGWVSSVVYRYSESVCLGK